MNTWFRKEDWWILAVVVGFLFVWLIFILLGESANSHHKRMIDCQMKGGTQVYLKYGGYKCLKELK